jgi:hypothetical protein
MQPIQAWVRRSATKLTATHIILVRPIIKSQPQQAPRRKRIKSTPIRLLKGVSHQTRPLFETARVTPEKLLHKATHQRLPAHVASSLQ